MGDLSYSDGINMNCSATYLLNAGVHVHVVVTCSDVESSLLLLFLRELVKTHF